MSYIFPPMVLVIGCSFPSALCVYWCTNNIISVIQSTIIRIPTVKEYLGLPKPNEVLFKSDKEKNNFKKG